MNVGGALAFIEMALPEGAPSSSTPRASRVDETMAEIREAFRGAGADLQVGNRLVSVFAQAGLPEPSMISETPVVGASSWALEWLARTVDSVRPPEVRAQSPWPAIERRMRAEAMAAQSQIFGPRNVAAWVRSDVI